MNESNLALDLSESGYLPDVVLRRGIRFLIKRRLDEISADDPELMALDQANFVRRMNNSPVALLTQKANEQHYEIPADFFRYVLGDYRKYSC